MARPKTVVIGMDGAPFPLIKKWAAEGKLPNLRALIDRGAFGVLKSTIPVHSPTAWASFITGLNPGNHGVYDFVRREPDSYRLRVIRADQYSGTSLWRLLSDHGQTVGVMNVPMTYPPEAVNGFLLSGLGTPDYAVYSFPPEMSEELDAKGYRVNKEFFFKEERQDEWLEDIHEITDVRGAAALKLMREEPWDFFMVVFRNSDEICHFYWHHMDETHPRHDPAAPARYQTAILDLYQHIDEWIGRIVEEAGGDTNIIVMSDHGAGPLYKDVFLNEWLIEQGWLKLRDTPSGQRGWTNMVRKAGLTRENISDTLTRLKLHRIEVLIKNVLGDRIEALPRDNRLEFVNAVDWSQTKAYSYGYYGQVFINLKGREPQGIVDPGQEYEELREEIKLAMQKIVDPADDSPVMDHIYTREDLFRGRHVPDAPDLLAIMREFTYMTRKGYEFAEQRGTLFREPYTNETGSHRLEGILIAAGPDIVPYGDLETYDIQDLTPTILHLQECAIPDYMDGRLIQPLFKPEFLAAHEAQYEEREMDIRDDVAREWTDREEAEITERLKKLGYLG